MDELQLDWLGNITRSVGLAVGLDDYVIYRGLCSTRKKTRSIKDY
jgi:hypothetical protein